MKTRRTSVAISLVFSFGVAACQGKLDTGLADLSDAGQGGSTGSLGTGGTGTNAAAGTTSATGGTSGSGGTSSPTGGATSSGGASSSAGTTSPTGGATRSGGTSNSAGTTSIPNPATGTQWARTEIEHATESLISSAAVDSSGNVYAVGQLWGPGTVNFGNSATVTGVSNGYNALLVKYDSQGTVQWGQTVTAIPDRSQFYSVAVDSSGNVYAAGYVSGVSGAVDFGNGVTVTKSDTFLNAVLVKYDSSGIAQWARTVTAGSSDSSFSSVAVDTSGNVYVAGEIDGTGIYEFGNSVTAKGTAISVGLLNPAGNVVLAKYNFSGIAQWAQTVTAGSPDSSFSSVAVDSSGNVYAAGSIAGTGTYEFGNGVATTGATSNSPIANQEGGNLVLVKYDSSGIAQWAQTVTAGSGGSGFSSVAVDSSGNVYAAGSIGGPETYDFGNGVTATGTLGSGAFAGLAGPGYVVLIKYNTSGIAQWAQTVTTGGPNSIFDSVAVDSSGNVYAAGSLYGAGTYDFGNGATATASTEGTNYVVLVKYNSLGIAQWARSSVNGGSSDAILASVTVDSMDNVYAAGGVGGTGVVDFGNNLTVTGTKVDAGPGWSALLVKYQ